MKKKKGISLNSLYAAIVFIFSGVVILTSCQTTPPTSIEREVSRNIQPALQAGEKKVLNSRVEKIDVDLSNRLPQRHSSIERPGRPLSNFVSENFLGSSRCAFCHELLTDKEGNDMSISNHWRSTMMANAAKDPLWQAKVSSEINRNPALRDVIEKKCTTCHMPMAWQQIMAAGSDGYVELDNLLDHTSTFHEAAMEGVSCTLCHQVRDVNLGGKESFGGNITIDTEKPAPHREIFGPYKDPFTKSMMESVGYTPTYGSHMNDSALCATCHTLFTPYVDRDGKVLGEFPEQTPYLEWLHSDYGVPVTVRRGIDTVGGKDKLCQECHMPHSEAGGVIVARYTPPEVNPQDHFSQHHFVGGNVFMLNILQDNLAPLALTTSTWKLEDTKQRTIRQLQNQTASISFVGLNVEKGNLTVVVEIDSMVGHKFPTGFPSRRAWIHFTVTDVNGHKVFESGRAGDDGSIVGDDSDSGGQEYERHHEVINNPDQVQIFETVMVDSEGSITWTLLRAAGYVKDNRLLPKGFTKETAAAEIAVYGQASADINFVGGSDRTVYQVNLQAAAGPLVVEAELLYTPVSSPFMKDLLRDKHLSQVRRFENFYDRADKAPVSVAAAAVRVEL